MVDFPNLPETIVNDPLANAQLELCCRVGSVEGLLEALEDGADINGNGGSPLYVAIMARDRAIVSALVQHGADTSIFEIPVADHDEMVDGLLALAPPIAGDNDADAEDASDPVDAKLVRAFDKLIRGKGLEGPLLKGRGGEYPSFRKGLLWIAAEDCEACVAEFLALLEAGLGEEGSHSTPVFLEQNAERISKLSERYRAASEAPTDLLKDYLKEKKD